MSRNVNRKLCISSLVFMALLLSAIASFAETYTHDNAGRLTDVECGDGTVVE